MAETDAEFLDRIESVDPFNPNWRPGDSVRLDMPDFARLFALARRGAAMDEAHAIGFREGAAHMHKAQAARIEQLEAALRRWEQYGCPDCGGDCASANPPVSCCIMQETRAALGKKPSDP